MNKDIHTEDFIMSRQEFVFKIGNTGHKVKVHVRRDPMSGMYHSLLTEHELPDESFCSHCSTDINFPHPVHVESYRGAIIAHFEKHHPKKQHLQIVNNA